MMLYHKLNSMQSDKTDNRNIYMKDFGGEPSLFIFERQAFCGDKFYRHTNGMEVELNELIEEAFQKYARIEKRRLSK